MTYYEAAVAVLLDAGQPLTSDEIVGRAIKRGLIRPKGKTPEATMSAVLYARRDAGPIRKVALPGRSRAKRGSVRWRL